VESAWQKLRGDKAKATGLKLRNFTLTRFFAGLRLAPFNLLVAQSAPLALNRGGAGRDAAGGNHNLAAGNAVGSDSAFGRPPPILWPLYAT